MSRRFCGVTAWTRASSEITAALSNTMPAWKELEYAARTRAQSANMGHACRQAGCAAWIGEASGATGGAALRDCRGLRVSFNSVCPTAGPEMETRTSIKTHSPGRERTSRSYRAGLAGV